MARGREEVDRAARVAGSDGELVMAEATHESYRRFPEYLQSAYTDILGWLGSQLGPDWNANLRHDDISKMLGHATLLSAAGQFYGLFPAHYFKVVHALQEVVGVDKLADWLRHSPQVCVLDIGCGAGTASAGFIEAILAVQPTTGVSPHVLCLAVDVNHYALGIYDRLMTTIEERTARCGLRVDHQLFREGIPAATAPIIQYLAQRRREWAQPSLAEAFVMQVNVVSPLGVDHEVRRKQQDGLVRMGVSKERIAALTTDFGQTEALAYKQILEAVPIDCLHVITIGTTTPGYLLQERVREMADTVERSFAAVDHVIERHWQGNRRVAFENPDGSYWRSKAGLRHSTSFYVDVTTAANASLRRDQDWRGVVALDNLRLAWARTRRGVLEHSLLDEVELRLFEHDLERNLTELQGQLLAYAADVARTEGRVAYLVPKDPSSARIRGLSRIEEEILSVAIIQRLGHKLSALRGSSYAYRVAPSHDDYVSEYLYENWFDAYMRFRDEARAEAQRHAGCAVVKTDIRGFFNRIVRDQLLAITGAELTQSERVRWLLRVLFSEDIDGHEAGRGIVQGNLGSGFYANVYLTSLDACFGANNRWGVKFHRYVDDMILVVPNPDDVPEVIVELRAKLKDLGLELHEQDDEGKTRVYTQVSEFLEDTAPDVGLEQLNADLEQVTNALWISCEDYRSGFRQAYWTGGEPWWYLVELYQGCLHTLGVFVSPTFLSRRLYRYLFSERRCREDLSRDSELTFPALPITSSAAALSKWADLFQLDNAAWVAERSCLVSRLVSLVLRSWDELRHGGGLDAGSKGRLERRIRFGINRLVRLGFAGSVKALFQILEERPEIIRRHGAVVEGLARQEFSEEISQLLSHYSDRKDEIGEYMRAVLLRGVRYLPAVEVDIWKSLVDWATKGSGTDALVATETWLFVADRCAGYVTEENVAAVECALRSESLVDTRLAKNYVLILGLYDASELATVALPADDLLKSARSLALEGGVTRLTGYHEPEVLRQTYYSGRRPYRPQEEDDLDASL